MKIRHYRSRKQSLAIKTSSRSNIRDLQARPLAKQFSEIRSSRCFIMLGVEFSGESTGTPGLIYCPVFSHRHGSHNCGTENRGTPQA